MIKSRVERIQSKLEAGQALLVTSDSNRFYFTGFNSCYAKHPRCQCTKRMHFVCYIFWQNLVEMSCNKKLIYNLWSQGIRSYKTVAKPNNKKCVKFF